MSFQGSELFGVKLKDDVSAVSQKMANSLEELNRDVKTLGDTFKRMNTGNLTLGLKEAKKLWESSAHNMKLFKEALKDAGVSALDARLLVNRFSSELTSLRRQALGMDGFLKRVFDPRTIWVASHSLNVLSKGLGAVRAVAGGVVGVLGSIYDVGKGGIQSVVENATKRQNTIETLAYAYQKPGVSEAQAKAEARTEFKWAQRMAKDTPLDTEQVTNALQQFTVAGYNKREARILSQVMADQASKNLGRPEMPANVIAAFSRMKGRGVGTAEDLESLRVAGFRAADVMEQLRKIPETADLFKGIKKSATEEEAISEVKKMLGKGKIGALTLGQAAINSLEPEGGPVLGTMAKKLGAESLQGAISNAKNAWDDLIQSVDAADWDGLKALREFLGKISAAFDSDTESGKRLLKTIEEATNNVLVGLRSIDQSDIDDFLAKIADMAKEVSKWIKDAWGWLSKMINSDVSITETLGEALLDVGVWIGQGIWKGMTTTAKALTDERYEKKHGIAKSEIEYQARLQGRPFAEVAADFDDRYKTAKWMGRIPEGATPQQVWGAVMGTGASAKSPYASLRKQAIGADYGYQARGSGVLDAGAEPAPTMSAADFDMGGNGVMLREFGPTLAELSGNIAALNETMGGVPKMASGGIVTRPTMALIGEAGPEAVVPLGSGGSSSVFGGDRSVTVVVHAGSGDAAQQWEAIRPLITREVTAVLTRVGAEA